MDALGMQAGQACGWVSATKETLRKFLLQHFPTHRNPKATAAQQAAAQKREAEVGGGAQPPRVEQAGQAGVDRGVLVQECVRMQQDLVERADGLALPAHFLDGTRC